MPSIPGSALAVALGAGLSLGGFCSCPDNHVVDSGRTVDLDSPRVVAASVGDCLSGIAPTGVGPTDPIRIVFSEPMDEGTLHEDTVLVVAGPVDDTFLSDVANPPLSDFRAVLVAPGTIELAADGVVTYTLLSPLAGLSEYTIVVSEDARDASGAPLVDALGQAGPFVCTFFTADAGSGPPLAFLLNPPPGATTGVPPNIRAVIIGFSEPVTGVGAASLRVTDPLDAAVAGIISNVDPACAGAAPGTCIAFVFSAFLDVSTEYTILLTSDIIDGEGQPLAETSFGLTTADVVDLDPPIISGITVTPGEDEASIRWITDEASTSVVYYAQGSMVPAPMLTLVASGGPGIAMGPMVFMHEVIVPGLAPLTDYTYMVESRDIADNVATSAPDGFTTTPPLPRVAITEIYANAYSSMEKWAEFIELYNYDTVPWDLTGWQIDNAGSLQALPTAILMPGDVALVVGTDYHMDLTDICPPAGAATPPACDVDPVAGTALLLVASTQVTVSGLSNSGETYRLLDGTGAAVSTYLNIVSTSSNEGSSVERIDPTGGDVAANWARNPDGTSTPGVVP